MKLSRALIRRDDSRFAVTFTEEAEGLKEAALNQAALIVRVTDEAGNAEAVEAQRAIKTALKLVEDARKICKEPVLDYGRKIDAAAKEFTRELFDEDLRLGQVIGNFQQQELARARAAEALRNKELLEIERRRMEEVAKAKSAEEAQAATERANQEAQALPPVHMAKAEGEIVKSEWQITVTDVWALARAHPMCVKIEPRLNEIKALLDSGIKVAGISAVKVAKATVRTSPQKAIEVSASFEANRPPLGWPTE